MTYVWYSMQDYPPPAGVRVLFGCPGDFVCEGFMAFFDQELKPVRYDGDRCFFQDIMLKPYCWTELPTPPKKEELMK